MFCHLKADLNQNYLGELIKSAYSQAPPIGNSDSQCGARAFIKLQESGDLAGWGGKEHQTKLTLRTMKVKYNKWYLLAKNRLLRCLPFDLLNFESTDITYDTIQLHRQ